MLLTVRITVRLPSRGHKSVNNGYNYSETPLEGNTRVLITVRITVRLPSRGHKSVNNGYNYSETPLEGTQECY